ncbi:MAG TPA: GntR family transcriptional regulator [Thermoleophilaceae bacterium]|nr:GntR family transcriptional regulator [Thermoleophilaceae bacterium]
MHNRSLRSLALVSTAEALADDLERRILQGEFAPGEHLGEVELSEEYQVGRHTLRAAFDRLVHRGLLVKQRNRGVSVRKLTADDLREIYEVREAIEAESVRILAGRRTVPEEAQRTTAHLRTLTTRAPRPDVIAADLGFHRALVEGSGNARLARVHHDLGAEIQLCLAQLVRGYAGPREIAAEHERLLEPIARGRVQASDRAIRDHFARALDWLVERVS